MKNKISMAIASTLLVTTFIPSMANAGNVKKVYINVAKEGSQATAADLGNLAANYGNITNVLNTKVAHDWVKGSTGIILGGQKVDKVGSDSARGKAMLFNGVNTDYVSIPSSNIDYSNGFTIEVWAYPTAVQNWGRFMDFGNNNAGDNLLFTRESTTNNLFFQIFRGSTSVTLIRATNVIELNKMQKFAVTMDTTGKVTLYKDGQAVATGTGQLPNNVERRTNFIAKSNWVADAFYKGYIDELRIWNKPLSSSDLGKDVQGNEENLVNLWKFDE